MKKPQKLTNPEIIILAAAALTVITLTAINLSLIGIERVAIIISGIIFYFCYLKINSSDMRYTEDFIQSGEASPGLIAGIISLHIQTSPFFTWILMLPVFIVSTIFQKLVLKREKKEILLNGFFLNIILLLVILFLQSRDSSFNLETTASVFTGLWNGSQNIYFSLSALFISTLLAAFIFTIQPELSLFSHGINLFRRTGIDYSKASFVITISRAFLLCISILLAGFLAGTGRYFQKQGHMNYIQNISLLLKCIAWSQFLLLLMIFTGPAVTIITSVTLSYILYYIYNGVNNGHGKQCIS